MEGTVVDSQPSWKCVEAVPAIWFALDTGVNIPRARARRLSIRTAEGRVESVGDGQLSIEDVRQAVLDFDLPSAIDLSPLVGTRARVTLRDEPLALGPSGQLLTISDADGRARVVACYGDARDGAHVLGDTRVRVALSQRAGGPVVFGTSQLQCIVHIGGHVEVRDRGGAWIMHVVARTAAGYAAYVIVERTLWRG
jgi:hypothetical protein